MEEYKHERAATEFEGDTGPITGSALDEVSMARRTFFAQIGRWSAAFALFGLGPEAWMRVVSNRSVISNVVAAEVLRDRLLQPWPAEDPFNMALGANAVYAPITDPATSTVRASGGSFNVLNGQIPRDTFSHPLYFPTAADPMHTIRVRPRSESSNSDAHLVRSYRPEENGQPSLQERLQPDAIQAGFGATSYRDGHLHILIGNDLVECFRFSRESSTSGATNKTVRNRLDHYSHGIGFVRQANGTNVWRTVDNDPLRNVHGTSAWGGSAIAGLIREAEIAGPNPHIPHALRLQCRAGEDLTGWQQGNPASPAYDFPYVFPATANDGGMGERQTVPERYGYALRGSVRMGMKFALDPNIVTDAWIMANAPKLPDGRTNMVQVAVAKALRDYGCHVCDDGPTKNSIGAEEFMDPALGAMLKVGSPHNHWQWLRPHLRRISAPGVQVPLQSHWRTWADAGQGWGGGEPRVPYARPLAPLPGDGPPPPPEAPGAIEVTGVRAFDGTG